MSRRPMLPLGLILSAVAFSAAMQAQTEPDTSSHVRTMPPETPLSARVSFAIDKPKGDAPPLEIRDAGAMSRPDQDLAADAEATIQEKAGFENLEFNQGTWTYKQLVCPALPNHLLLRFSRDDGTRSMSMFSAAIPRAGEGKIRIIPIVRRGYSLFSPAPINALTISAFNHIRAEEHFDAAPDWVGTGLCYAALAGANPQIVAPVTVEAKEDAIPLATPPTLLVEYDGAIISFVDVAAAPRAMEWSMTFNRKGQLLKARHSPAYLTSVRRAPGTVEELPGRLIPAAGSPPAK